MHLPLASIMLFAPQGWEDEARKIELTKFYRKHDPPRIAMVGQILSDYPFKEVVKSLQAKYKEVPQGW